MLTDLELKPLAACATWHVYVCLQVTICSSVRLSGMFADSFPWTQPDSMLWPASADIMHREVFVMAVVGTSHLAAMADRAAAAA